ncbi:synaptonemal complex protein [Salix suchowensis]|nr:synaptonemal complex protein [Salix suchowensis]
MEAKLLENDNSLENLKQEFTKVKSAEAHSLDLLSQSKKRIQELEAEVQRGKESEMKLLDSFSKLEITSLHTRVEGWEKHGGGKISLQKELESLRSELQLARQAGENHSASKNKDRFEGMELLKHELKLATEAEENSKKAMDDLVLALSEVATEPANKGKARVNPERAEHFKKEAEKLKNHFWPGMRKETGFVDCIKRAEDENCCALKENSKLLELLQTAENMNGISKQETQKVRDILENSQLKDVLAEKDIALVFITQENENLRINESAALEHIKE